MHIQIFAIIMLHPDLDCDNLYSLMENKISKIVLFGAFTTLKVHSILYQCLGTLNPR